MRQAQFVDGVSQTMHKEVFLCSSTGVCTCLGGKVAARLELLEEGWHEDGGEEEDHAPEEDVRDVGAVGATSAAYKVPVQLFALLMTHNEEEGKTWGITIVTEIVIVMNVSGDFFI